MIIVDFKVSKNKLILATHFYRFYVEFPYIPIEFLFGSGGPNDLIKTMFVEPGFVRVC